MPDDKKKFGVITEQGFPAGQLGYTPLSESDQEKLNDKSEDKNDK